MDRDVDRYLESADALRRRLASARRQAGRSAQPDANALLVPLDECLLALADLRRLGEDLRREDAARTHAILWGVTEGRLNLVDDDGEIPAPTPAVPGSPVVLDDPEALRTLRRLVEQAAAVSELPDERRDALISAVGEAAANAIVHGGGGRADAGADAGTVRVRVTDRGPGIPRDHLPRVLLEMGYSLAGTGGFGLKIVLRAVDRVHLRTGPGGTTLQLEQSRTAPEPSWAVHHDVGA